MGAGLAAGALAGGNAGAGVAAVSGVLLKTDCAGMSGDAAGDIGAGEGEGAGDGDGGAVVVATGRVCATGLRRNNPGCAICKYR